MHVEECCFALLSHTLPKIDNSREGLCIDVGVGTFAFYCELFSRMGFETVAVEPLPTKKLRVLCKVLGITLFESCLTDKDGIETIYIGTFQGSDNLNLSSLMPDWWGSSAKSEQVNSVSLSTLLKSIRPFNKITCLKIDVEGVELLIIKQLLQILKSKLPSVVQFEYGGGGTLQEKKGGWSEKAMNETLSCLEILKKSGYKDAIVVDSAPSSVERIISLEQTDINPMTFFEPNYIYGNVILFKDKMHDVDFYQICEPYRNNKTKPPPVLPPGGGIQSYRKRFFHMIIDVYRIIHNSKPKM